MMQELVWPGHRDHIHCIPQVEFHPVPRWGCVWCQLDLFLISLSARVTWGTRRASYMSPGFTVELRVGNAQSYSCLWQCFTNQVWVIYLILLSGRSREWMWLHCCIVVNVTVKYCTFLNIILFQISANCYWVLGRGTCDLTDTLPWQEESSCLENEGTPKIATCKNPRCTFVLQFYQQEFENLE